MATDAGRLLLVVLLAVAPSTAAAKSRPIQALAPLEVIAGGFRDPSGLAVDAAANVYVADRDAGTVTRIAPDRTRTRIASGLRRPIGLAFDSAGRLLVAEEKAGRVVRVEATGARTPVADGIKQPRWLAGGENGTLYVAARRVKDAADSGSDSELVEPEVILALTENGTLATWADGFRDVQALVAGDGALYATTAGRRDAPRAGGRIFKIPILADGRAGPPEPLGPAGGLERPTGLARDRLGALYFTDRRLDLADGDSKDTIGKLHPGGAVTRFASGLRHAEGLAVDADGNLYVADGSSRQVIRFLAPPPPALGGLAEFTNRSPILVTGKTEPGARVSVLLPGTGAVVAMAAATGAFTVPVAIGPNSETALDVFATAERGDGLTSAPTEARVTHDDVAPSLTFLTPPAGAFVRGTVPVQAGAGDGGSQVATLVLSAGTRQLGGAVTPQPPAPSTTITATWETSSVPDGTQALAATATDRAGNSAAISRVVLVDNTAPETEIDEGPTGEISESGAIFTFSGADNLTPAGHLEFAWRLDDGPWSSFDSDTSVTLTGLPVGGHHFEVKARDRAGNEDPTPAQRGFAVSRLRVAITEPADGATLSPGVLVVRGVAEGGGELGVLVNGFPGAVEGDTFAALVPVASDTTTLGAVLTTQNAGPATHTISIFVAPDPAPRGELLATPQSGLAPLTVTFTLLGQTPAAVSIDFEGDGAVDSTGASLDGRQFTYTRPGLYFPAVTVTDAQGDQQTIRGLVHVLAEAALDTLLRSKWDGMKRALMRGDLEAALLFVVEGQQPRYRALFTALSGQIPQIARDMQDIQRIYVLEGRAKYRIRRIQTYGGRPVTLTYYVYFTQDASGLWSIDDF